MVPNLQLCCMFSFSLYERYSSSTASLYLRIVGSTGSERSNAPHGVGSCTRDIRDVAVKLHDHCEYVSVDTPGFKDSDRLAIQ
ncbi:hypothetical protein PISMIDRAFT_684547 [Pisolithus microcarpus 441]|uniref:Uncharacterized protein n=1 Tax=Pisolithus microcarpus 441 TaxID=765257 RepID=A0A0C9YN18_9AGAM|nr:hypothetical protein PISMIDRAFT_684547 [Pisolithus microcarpus 441]